LRTPSWTTPALAAKLAGIVRAYRERDPRGYAYLTSHQTFAQKVIHAVRDAAGYHREQA